MAFSEPNGSRRDAEKLSKAIRKVSATLSEQECFDQFPAPPDKLKQHQQLTMGQPLFVPDQVKIKKEAAEKAFLLLIDAFRGNLDDINQDLDRLDQAVQAKEISPLELLEITLHHHWGKLKSISLKLSIDTEILQFFTIYLARPFRQQAAERLWSGDLADNWHKGYCPVCGHHPVLGRIYGEPAHRELWCCCCNTTWKFTRIGCPVCSNQSQNQLGYLTIESYPLYRIYVCDKCRRYLKINIDESEINTEGFKYDLEYLKSASLDQAALAQGYISEPIWISRNDFSGDLNPEVCSDSK